MLKRIRVTQGHIKRGEVSAPNCPIALAICEQFDNLDVAVYPTFISLHRQERLGKYGITIETQPKVAMWIRQHDRAKTKWFARSEESTMPKPFSFDLEIPDEFLGE